MMNQQFHESPKVAEAFALYCRIEDRSLEKLRCHFGVTSVKIPSLRQIEAWSSKYRWQERVQQFDLAQAELLQKQVAKDIERERRRKQERENKKKEQRDRLEDEDISLLLGIRIKVLRNINELLEERSAKGLFGLNSLLKTALDELHLDLGAPTSIQEQRVSGTVQQQHSFDLESARRDMQNYEAAHPLEPLES